QRVLHRAAVTAARAFRYVQGYAFPGWSASVGAGVEGGPVEGLLALGVDALAARDVVGAALLEFAHQLGGLARDDALGGVLLKACARVRDVEVAHGQLADAVFGAERGIRHSLHRQLVGVVAERGALGVEDRVVVAAAQAQRDGARDGGADPAHDRLAQHERLRVEPAALVHETAEAAALVVVVRDSVFVVDRVEQALVGDVEEGHAGGLVESTALGLDDAVLDLVARAEAVTATDAV